MRLDMREEKDATLTASHVYRYVMLAPRRQLISLRYAIADDDYILPHSRHDSHTRH